ncbi:hypothetical protein ACP4OV_005540 [Aristida adscensionis]
MLEKKLLLRESIRDLLGYEPRFPGWRIGNNGDVWLLIMWSTGPGFVTMLLYAVKEWYFTVDLETMELRRVAPDMWGILYRYELPWPPALHACLEIGDGATAA